MEPAMDRKLSEYMPQYFLSTWFSPEVISTGQDHTGRPIRVLILVLWIWGLGLILLRSTGSLRLLWEMHFMTFNSPILANIHAKTIF
jgi:hypothetical protein